MAEWFKYAVAFTGHNTKSGNATIFLEIIEATDIDMAIGRFIRAHKDPDYLLGAYQVKRIEAQAVNKGGDSCG